MRSPSRCAALVSLAIAAFVVDARAEPLPNIEIWVPEACTGAQLKLREQLERALAGKNAADVEASVTIEESEAGYRVTLVTNDGLEAPADKIILAPTCDEAVDATVVVLALAFSAARIESLPPAAPTEPVEAARAPAPPFTSPVNARADVGPVSTASPPERADASRVSLSTGADSGTLPAPTLVVAAGVARSFSALEVRGLLRYGLPTVEADETDGLRESARNDFGAMELRACYGVGARIRVSACTGGELGVIRSVRRIEAESGVDIDEDSVAPRLSGVLAAVVSHRGGAIQPELELSGSGVAVGRHDQASWVSLRVAAGAAVEF